MQLKTTLTIQLDLTFIETVQEGADVAENTDNDDTKTTISLGNGFLSDYSMEASVGSIPSASVTVEGFNMKADEGMLDSRFPALLLKTALLLLIENSVFPQLD